MMDKEKGNGVEEEQALLGRWGEGGKIGEGRKSRREGRAAPLSPPVRSANQSSSLPPASPSLVRLGCSSTVWPPGDKYGNTQKIPGWTSGRERASEGAL